MKWTDQTGYTIELEKRPTNIISLVPSQTELLYDLGLENEVIGITKFCIHPDSWHKVKDRIGGTKNVRHDHIKKIMPDLILANKEENTRDDIEKLRKDYPVWTSDVKDLSSAYDMIESISKMVGRSKEGEELMARITSGFTKLDTHAAKPRVLYLIWKDPIMAAGSDTFINDMLNKAGFVNVLEETRYPTLTAEEIIKLNPDFVLLSSEPFPFKGKHIADLKERFPTLKMIEVDGELFSWYGSRLAKSPAYFISLREKLGL